MKKLLSMLVIICVLISACLVGAMPASAAEINYDDFDIYDGILVEYIGEGGDVVIPAKDADGNPVTEIDSRAFQDNDTITSVKIPEGITKIGGECFQYCDYLETVSLPYSLEKCGFATFRHCKSLTKIEIPSSMKSIPQDFCSEANALSEIVISYGVEKIGVYAFCGMKNIDRIVIPASVTDLFGFSFANCSMAECDVYICNPLCDVGYMNGYKSGSNATGKEYTFAFSSPQHARTSWTIYVPKGSTVASDMIKQAETYTSLNYRIREAEQSVFDALPENQKDYGYQGVKDENQDTDGDGTADGQQGGDNAGDNNNTIGGILGGGNGSNGSGLDLTTLFVIVGVIFGGLILIIIAVVVIVIVVKNNKKKKKAAAKAARRAAKAAAAEEVVEDAPAEEEIADEIPVEDAE